MQLLRGKKRCPKCDKIYGARKLECVCGHIFIFKTNKPKQKYSSKNVNWKELIPGDKIKVLKQGGPYHINQNKTKTYIGSCGIFYVKAITSEGIICRGEHGVEYVYMGQTVPSTNWKNIIRVPHKIKKLS